MKTAVLIQARTGSTRLPGKVLLPVEGEPLLGLMLERLKGLQGADALAVVTTGSPQDDPLEAFCRERGVPCLRGSERDVLGRYHAAARELGAEVVVRLTADCPLIDPRVVEEMIALFQEKPGRWDYLANTAPPPGTYPDGMDVEVFSFTALDRAWREAEKPSEREHVTFYLWKEPGRFKTHRLDAPRDLSRFRFTVDYPDDLEYVGALVKHLKAAKKLGGLDDLVAYAESHPRPNRGHPFGAGWAPSLEADRKASAQPPLKAPPLKLEAGDALFKKAAGLIPTGSQTFSKTPSQFVDGAAPKVLVRGRGARVWDPDGNEFVDFTLGLGPAVLGHGHTSVNEAAAAAARDFSAPPLPHPLEARLAETLTRLIPCAERVRFGKNGSDVTAGAVRLARAVTKRDVVACCGYHGWQDWYIGSTTRRAGVPEAVRALTIPFTYNDPASLEKIFKDKPGNVAAVILEPVTFFEPKDGFLHKVQDLCRKNGALLIFDEIITGFRIHTGGAQSYFGVTPDLAAFGKAMANGWPISALVGKAEIMKNLEEVFFSFTFGGELPSIAAAIKTLEILEAEQVPGHIARMGRMFKEGFNRLSQELGTPFTKAIGLDFWPEYVLEEQPGASALEVQTLFQQEIVRRGILTRPALMISRAHGEPEIRELLSASRAALLVVRDALKRNAVKSSIDGKIITPVIRAQQ